MPTYTQAHRPIAITTPLGKDVLLLTGFRGQEAISQLFNFQVELLAESKNEIHFDRIIGQNVTVEMGLPNEEKRYFNGLVKRFSQGARDETFVHFRAELVPKLWLLTKKVRSRIFQHLSVPEILRQVLRGLDVTYQISGTYYQRDYCVQYRESDFDFASRLMEEEGIYYFFKHGEAAHQMVTTDVPNRHPDVSGQSNVIYEEVSGGMRKEMRITAWEKSQELRSGEYTLWDHCFELPDNHLEAKKKTIDSVVVGEVTHKLSVGGNDQLEIYDFPGGYAQRFDGIDHNGTARPQDLKEIFPESERTAKVRMEEEDAASLGIAGQSNCGNFVAGHNFKLERHYDANDLYLLTRVEHDARLDGNYRTSEASAFNYENRFTCIPVALPYRPQRVTRKPVIAGIQTATVVGPHGEEIFCDMYGRVKVQFHWDREGKKDANSSCWLRVAQVWAGKGWGAFFWPRVEHEVVVIFEEGDPDQPLIIGSVYNAKNMPWFGLPVNKKLGGIKSASERGTAHKNYNAIVFNDEKGYEHLSLHSERNLSLNSEFDKMINAGRHKGERVAIANVLTVGKLIPGGGSGGGFDEGNPLPKPNPTGVLGLNSAVTFGENLQAAFPINHQLAVGSNFQLCINPAGLLAGAPGIAIPGILEAVLGSGMGGNMQFTMGTSAQFTLGQSFEISIGPPKIEIHNPYEKHVPTIILCTALGGVAIAFLIAYDMMAHKESKTVFPQGYTQDNSNIGPEQPGDKERANLVLAYQLAVDALLCSILAVESVFSHLDWLADDLLKKLVEVDSSILKLYTAPDIKQTPGIIPGWHENWGQLALAGSAVMALAIGAEIAAEEAAGGGTGGGIGMDESGNILQSADSTYQIAGNQVVLLSRKALPLAVAGPSADPGPSLITILAAGGPSAAFADDGQVDVRGCKGVRITAGSPVKIPLGTSPPVTNASTDGVEIIVAEMQKITLQCGVQMPPPSQKFFQTIEMTPDGITLQSGANPTDVATVEMKPDSITLECKGLAGGGITMTVWEEQEITIQRGLLPSSKQTITMKPDGIVIQSATAIKLSAGLGLSEITLDQDGVTIEGATVNIKGASVNVTGGEATPTIATPAVNIEGPLVNIKGDLVKIN